MSIELLIHSDDPDGSSDFVDSSYANRVVTGGAGVEHSTAQAKFAGSSIYMPGGTGLQVDDSPDWATGSNIFWGESWYYIPSLSVNIPFFGQIVDNDNRQQVVYNNATGQINIYIETGNVVRLNANGNVSIPRSQWIHVGWGWTTSEVYFFINGVRQSLVVSTSLGSVGDISAPVTFGQGRLSNTNYYLPVGTYIDEIRLIKGEIPYTENFDPPSSPYSSSVDILHVFRLVTGEILLNRYRVYHGLVPQVLKIFRALPGAAPVRQKVLRVVHDQARSFVKIFRAVHQQSTFVQSVFRVVHQQQNAVVLRVFRAVHGTVVGDAVLKVFRAVHGLVSSVYRNDNFDVSISVNGQPVLSWATAILSTDEGRFVWEAQIEVKSQWDGETLLGQYDSVIYRRYGTDYHLIVVDRARGIQVGDNSYEDGWTVQLASPAYKLSAASASLITKTWPRATAAKAIVQELCDSKNIALDWQAPEYIIGELVADKQTPIDIIKTVLNVIGALPQSAPDGTLVVRKETPVMPYNNATPDTSFAALSISSLSEQGDDPQVLYNAIAVMDADDASDGGGLQHLETDRDDGGKDIFAWSEPWATVALRVNSGAGETTLSPLGIEVAEYLDSDGEPEWLQFVDGEATSTRPVYQNFEVVAYRGDNPGAVTWTQDSKTLTAANGGDYYVQVRYKWRYYRFIYYSNTDYDYQVILTD